MRKILSAWFLLTILLLALLPYQALAVKVVVDAGHGGYDPGAKGVNGLEEKNVTLDIARRLQTELVKRGYEAVMSRNTDDFVSLADRVAFTNEQNADLFVSVHANWYSNPDARGTMVLYYDNQYPQASYPASTAMQRLTPESRSLAQNVLDAFVGKANTANKGLVPSAVYVVRMGSIPSILVETAFLSNSADAALLVDDQEKQLMAEGIAEGIEAYRPAVFPDTAGHWARPAILRLKDKGIVQGAYNLFNPDRALTRAEFVTIASRAFPFPQGTSPAGCAQKSVTANVYAAADCSNETVFSDLHEDHWAYQTLSRAAELGYIDGYQDGTMQPDQPITRQEAAVLLNRILSKTGTTAGTAAGTQSALSTVDSPLFRDVPPAIWSAAAIYRLRAEGIITGKTAQTFAPLQDISRAEMCAMIDRYLNGDRDQESVR